MSWREIALGDVIHIKHGYAFKSQHFVDDGEYIVLTPGNIHEVGGFRLRIGKDRAYEGDIPEGFILNEGDLIVAMTEQGPGLLGSSALIPKSDRFLHNQRLGLIDSIDAKILNKHFLYYLFNTYSVRGQISGSASGTKVRHTSPDKIYKVRVKVPSVPEQERIAEVLSMYDALLENNLNRISLLSQSAHMIYKEWFVRFRFPGHTKLYFIDDVPVGWRKGKVSDLGEIITGKTPSTKDDSNFDGSIPFVKTPDMHNQIVVLKTEQNLSEKGANSQPNKYIPKGSVMVSCIGSVGVVSMTSTLCQTNQQINSVKFYNPTDSYYAFFALSDLKPLLEGMGGGATMGNVNKTKFSNVSVLIPDSQILLAFKEVVEPIFSQIETLLLQNEKLLSIRNLLLPRLLKGEISV